MDEHRFYYEAGNRICSSLQIEKALFRCFLFIRDFIPADSLTLHLFDPGLGFIETIVDADIEGGKILSHKTRVDPAVREQIKSFIEYLNGKPQCQILERLSLDEMAGGVARDHNVPDDPAMILEPTGC